MSTQILVRVLQDIHNVFTNRLIAQNIQSFSKIIEREGITLETLSENISKYLELYIK